MSIEITFTNWGTVLVECNGEVLEVPLPGSGSGIGTHPGGVTGAAQPIPVNPATGSPRSVVPRDPRDPSVARPPNEPTIAGIITTGNSGPLPLEAFILERGLATPRPTVHFMRSDELAALEYERVRETVANLMAARTPAYPFFIDVRVVPSATLQRVHLTGLQQLLQDPVLNLRGIRLVTGSEGE